MRLSIRYKRAEEVFGALLSAYHAKRFPYHRLKLPQEAKNLPKTMPRGQREEAFFFFAVCYYMRLTESVGAVRKMARFYDTFPGYFFPETFEATVAEHGELVDQLIAFGLAFQCRAVARGWVINFRKLQNYWGGDPRTLFKGISTYDGLCRRMIFGKHRRIKGARSLRSGPYGFVGFRYKMVSMLTYFYVDTGVVAPIMHPVPVDFHVMRILLTSETIVGNDTTIPFNVERVSTAARKVSVWYCEKHGVDPIDLCNVLWYLSRTYCKRQIGNRSDVGPARGRDTVVTPKPVIWTPARITGQIRTCGMCPIQATCRYSIPVAVYSKKGQLILRSERPKPPGQARFGFYPEYFQHDRPMKAKSAQTEEIAASSSQRDLFEAPS